MSTPIWREPDPSDGPGPGSGSGGWGHEAASVWRLVTTVAAVEDPDECTRLLLTGLPALVAARITGWAEKRAGGGWSLRVVPAAEGRRDRTREPPVDELRSRFLELARRSAEEGRLLVDPAVRLPGTKQGGPGPTATCVAAPVRSLSRNYGALLVACEADPGPGGREHVRRAADFLALRLEDLSRAGGGRDEG